MSNVEARESMRGALKAIPDLGKLLLRLTRDPRVPRRNKLIFGGIAAYLLLPIDFIPDWIPGIGQVDDIALVALALDAMVNRVGKEVLAEHWDGDDQMLENIRGILGTITKFVPEAVKSRIFWDDDEDTPEIGGPESPPDAAKVAAPE